MRLINSIRSLSLVRCNRGLSTVEYVIVLCPPVLLDAEIPHQLVSPSQTEAKIEGAGPQLDILEGVGCPVKPVL